MDEKILDGVLHIKEGEVWRKATKRELTAMLMEARRGGSVIYPSVRPAPMPTWPPWELPVVITSTGVGKESDSGGR